MQAGGNKNFSKTVKSKSTSKCKSNIRVKIFLLALNGKDAYVEAKKQESELSQKLKRESNIMKTRTTESNKPSEFLSKDLKN